MNFTARSLRPEQTARPRRTAMAAVAPVLDRLIAVLDDESNQISSKTRVDYVDLNQRKSRALLELMNLRPLLAGAADAPELAVRLSGLVERIEKNSYLLNVELLAARRVSELISNAIKDGQSDGTYSEYGWRGAD